MIKMITGVPGAGKTFFAVRHLAAEYYKIDDEGSYQIKKGVTVISNIDNLHLEHLSLEEEIKNFLEFKVIEFVESQGISDEKAIDEVRWNLRKDKMLYFEKDHQEKVSGRYGKVVYVIDECQEYFSTKMHRFRYARNIFMWLETHRHLGQDIILVTQSSLKIARDIRDLVEYEIRALPKSLSIFGEMKYNEYTNRVKSNAIPKAVRPDKKIFALYKSMDFKGAEKHGTALKSIAVLMIIGLIGGGSFLYFGFIKKHTKSKNDVAVEIASVNQTGMTSKSGPAGKALNSPPALIETMWFPVSFGLVNNRLGSMQIYDELNNLLLPLDMWDRETKIVNRTIYAKFTRIEVDRILQLRAERGAELDEAEAESQTQPPAQTNSDNNLDI